MALSMQRLAETIGAQINGIDLCRPLWPEDVAAIREAWSSYRVLLFRNQAIDDHAHASFASHFGTPLEFLSNAGEDRSPYIYGASNTDVHGRLLPAGSESAEVLKINWYWHVDGCYRAMPNLGVVLRALEVPPVGGDTMFADMYHAWEFLPPVQKSRIRKLLCQHSFSHMIEHCGMAPVMPEEVEKLPSALHPLVWHHSDGRRSLFLSPPYVSHIDSLSYGDTRALIDELTVWASADRFVYQHHWKPGDVLIWDNRWTMHKVTPYDLVRHRRVMRGATLTGTEIPSSHV